MVRREKVQAMLLFSLAKGVVKLLKLGDDGVGGLAREENRDG